MKRSRISIVVITMISVVAAGIVWYYFARGDGRLPKPDAQDTRLTVASAPEGRQVTFPAVNKWDAPLVPLESSGFLRRYRTQLWRTRGTETRKCSTELTLDISVTRAGLARLRELQEKPHDDLLKAVSRSVRAVPVDATKLTLWALRALLMARSTDARAPAPDTRRFNLGISDDPAYDSEKAIDAEDKFDRLDRTYHKDGWLWCRGGAGKAVRLEPLFPEKGQTWQSNGDTYEAVCRQTISLRGGVFRCWLLKYSYEHEAGRIVYVGEVSEWYAPGLGLVLRLGKDKTYMDTIMGYRRLVQTNLLRDELREAFLPQHGAYWRADGQ